MKKRTGSMVSYLNTVTRHASTSETGYTVQQIDVTKIIPNQKNFYSITGIEELANSFSVSDQMPPLDVVDNGDGTYRLISGERRLSATLFRIERGEIAHAELPCHVLPAFRQEGSLTAEQMETLSIILANNYRQKTTLDQLREVQELEPIARAIYEDEKAKGVLADNNGKNTPFRTFFAEQILAISPAALQRLKALENLSDEAVAVFKEGRISKSVATELAALPEDDQRVFVEGVQKGHFAGTSAELQSLHSHDEEKHLISPMKETTVWEEPCTETFHPSGHHQGDIKIPDDAVKQEDDAKEQCCTFAAVLKENEQASRSSSLEEPKKSLETILEEVEGQNRLPFAEDMEETDEVVTEIETSSFTQLTSNEGYGEYMTIEDAAKILMNLQTEFEKDGRHREGIALKKACTALYEWRNRHET
jgi:parB protein